MLDWSQVQQAPEEQLGLLLTGLDLVEHNEILGIDTIPDDLTSIVPRILSKQANKTYRTHDEQTVPTYDHTTPVVWTPEKNTDQDTATPPAETAQQPVVKGLLREPSRTILQPLSPSALRDELERLVLQDLLGPAGGPEEELDESSGRDRYLLGMLAPRDTQMQPDELDELAIPEESSAEDGLNDDAALPIASLCPPSIGMSFNVEGTATSLLVKTTNQQNIELLRQIEQLEHFVAYTNAAIWQNALPPSFAFLKTTKVTLFLSNFPAQFPLLTAFLAQPWRIWITVALIVTERRLLLLVPPIFLALVMSDHVFRNQTRQHDAAPEQEGVTENSCQHIWSLLTQAHEPLRHRQWIIGVHSILRG